MGRVYSLRELVELGFELHASPALSQTIMPRKRARLTRPRKKPQNVSGGDPDSPSTDEWAGMVQYGSFIGEGYYFAYFRVLIRPWIS